MEHNHNIGCNFERFVVARFLVSTVAFVLLVNNNVFNTKLFTDFNGIVFAAVVNQNYFVNYGKIDFVVGFS